MHEPDPESAAPDSLAELLLEWNRGVSTLDPRSLSRLMRLARLELGLSPERAPCDAGDVGEFAKGLRPLLPTTREGKVMANLWGDLRHKASRALHIPSESIHWHSAWVSLARLINEWWIVIEDFLEELLSHEGCNTRDPGDCVGDTVRSIWKAHGGAPFWELAPYETEWCPSQKIFYDLRNTPLFIRPLLEREHKSAPIAPSTELKLLVADRKQPDLIEDIEARFGVWLGRRPKEGCLPVIIAGILASPLSLGFIGCLMVSLEMGRSSAAIPFALWAACIGAAVALYFRSQPRLPSNVRTFKDLVRAIVHQRKAEQPAPRIRPIQVLAIEGCEE